MSEDRAPWEKNQETPAEGQPSLAERALPKVPPPPSDISLRTMASDLNSIKETGGSRPKPVTISVGISALPEALAAGSSKSAASKAPDRSVLFLIVGIVLVVIATVATVLWLRK